MVNNRWLAKNSGIAMRFMAVCFSSGANGMIKNRLPKIFHHAV